MKRNMCKDCKYGEAFQDQFTGKIRHRCKIGQCEDIGFGDMALIIDGECSKYKTKSETCDDYDVTYCEQRDCVECSISPYILV